MTQISPSINYRLQEESGHILGIPIARKDEQSLGIGRLGPKPESGMYKDGVSTSHAYLVGSSVMEISPGGDPPTYRIPRTSNMLRITVTENESEQRWVLQGRLTGSFLEELIASWCANRDRPQTQSRTVDLNEITCIDKDGEQVLLMMIKDGAKFVATGLYTKHLLESLSTKVADSSNRY